MNNSHADITIVLDRSGSMDMIATDTEGGLRRFITDQKKCPGTADLTLHQFDDKYETSIPTTNIQQVDEKNVKLEPRGSTALLDAIGRSINDTGKRLGDTPEDKRAGKVIFAIVTDGFENASHEFTQEKINEMIKHQQDKYKWEFVFLAADQDAIKTARGLGINTNNAMTYAKNVVGTQSSYSSFSGNVSAFRSGGASNMAWSADDKKKQEDAGADPSTP